MREIKFRGWHNKKKEMFSPEEMGRDQLTIMPDGRGFINVHGSSTRLSSFPDMIPMQYTGLKDTDGVDIYEGDYVRCSLAEGVVKYWNSQGSFRIDYPKGSIAFPMLHFNSCSDYKIIGNIYQNPELITKGTT